MEEDGRSEVSCSMVKARGSIEVEGPSTDPGSEVQFGTAQGSRMEIDKLIKAGAFIKRECKICSPTFLIPKKDGSMRLIHDLRQVNRALDAPRFTLRGAQEAADVVRASKVLVTLDLRKGYQQVMMSEEARQYLGARWNGATVHPRFCHSDFQ